MDDQISRQAAINALMAEHETLEAYMEECLEKECFASRADAKTARNRIEEDIYILENLPSAQQWIPVSEHLPENFEEVNITWVNHDPAHYYAAIKNVPFVASGVFYKGRWYWWSAVCADYLREYGHSPADAMDERIEVVAWKPMPEPYKEGE